MKATHRPLRAPLACVLLLCPMMMASGCSFYSSPVLTPAAASVGERTAAGQEMEFLLDATNTNDEALPLRDVSYSVFLDDREVFTGTRSAEQTLRRTGTQQVRLPAVVRLDESDDAALASGARRYRLTGRLRYVTPGALAEALFDSGVRVPETSFVAEGEIDFGPGGAG